MSLERQLNLVYVGGNLLAKTVHLGLHILAWRHWLQSDINLALHPLSRLRNFCIDHLLGRLRLRMVLFAA